MAPAIPRANSVLVGIAVPKFSRTVGRCCDQPAFIHASNSGSLIESGGDGMRIGPQGVTFGGTVQGESLSGVDATKL
jgi:hypothetical protein